MSQTRSSVAVGGFVLGGLLLFAIGIALLGGCAWSVLVAWAAALRTVPDTRTPRAGEVDRDPGRGGRRF